MNDLRKTGLALGVCIVFLVTLSCLPLFFKDNTESSGTPVTASDPTAPGKPDTTPPRLIKGDHSFTRADELYIAIQEMAEGGFDGRSPESCLRVLRACEKLSGQLADELELDIAGGM